MSALFAAATMLALSSASANAAMLDASALARLDRLPVGAAFALDAFPDGAGGAAHFDFKRVDVYAPGARVLLVDATGEHELPRSRRVELIGGSREGGLRATLSFDPGVVGVSGVLTTSSGTFAIDGTREGGGLALRAKPLESTYPAGVVPHIAGGDDALATGRPQPSALEIALAGRPAGSLRTAVVAVDTDNELMFERFSNNTAQASAWIADLFATMNVMYQRDLDVVLQQGTTMLRTAADPYSQDGLPAADQPDLVEFGTYWQAHYAAVQRSFAMLLSGKSSSGNSASGIAWVNAYCQTQSQGGSYSFTEVFTNPQIGVALSALVVGHELGHNFGAYHTHCTNASTGGAPTGTNTIDKCFSGESGCYSGAESCPSSGPGAPAGTIMSYCNLNQCGPTGQNVAQFHPTQIGVLNVLIAQHTPSCLAEGSDRIFFNGFD
jgi:hypothetical protein